jgi:hypothetical protein
MRSDLAFGGLPTGGHVYNTGKRHSWLWCLPVHVVGDLYELGTVGGHEQPVAVL